MPEEFETSRFILNVREFMQSAYRKWNSIIYDMDQVRDDMRVSNNILLSVGILNPDKRSSSDVEDEPEFGEFLVIKNSDHRDTVYLGHSVFNVGGFVKTTGGKEEKIVDIEFDPPPSSDTEDHLAFLEVWREVVYPGMDIYYNGHFDGEVLRESEDEFLLRIRWRVRTVADIDFDTYPSGMEDSNVKVKANSTEVTDIDFEETDTDSLYKAIDESEELEVYENEIYAIPLLKVTRVAGEDYIDIENLEIIGGIISTFLHAEQHHTGGIDELQPVDIDAIHVDEIGDANGIPPLDENTKIPEEYMPDIIDVIQSDLSSHISDEDNPHNVNYSQVGAPPTSRRIDTGTGLSGGGSLASNKNLTLDTSYLDNRYASYSHLEDYSNPHNVTKSQINLNNVINERQVKRSGDTMQGELIAHNNTNYEQMQVRNVYISTDEPDDQIGDNGDLWLQYEE